MAPIKTQIEIKYTNILNFRDIYKPLVAPYAKLGNVEISNADTFDESIVISLPDDKMVLEVRWDRMIFNCDSKPDNFFSPNGPLMYLFQILDRLTKADTFGEIKAVAYALWTLDVVDRSDEEICSLFKEKYYKETFPTVSGFTEYDLGMQAIYKDKDITINGQFGPFKQEDIQNFGLKPFWPTATNELLAKKGILGRVFMLEKTKTASIDVIKKMDRKLSELAQQVKLLPS